MEIGHHIAGPAVKAVGKGAVVKGLVLVGIPHPVPEEKGVEPLGDEREDEAPDAVADEVAVDLGAGGEAAAELGGEGHKGDAHGQRHGGDVDERCAFLGHLGIPPMDVCRVVPGWWFSGKAQLLNSMTLPGLRMSLSSKASLMALYREIIRSPTKSFR